MIGNTLHLLPGEKIADNLVENFSHFEKQFFYIFSGIGNTTLKCTTKENVYIYDGESLDDLCAKHDIKVVVIHAMYIISLKLIWKLKAKNIKIAWLPWGFDLYLVPDNKHELYDAETKKIKKRCYKLSIKDAIAEQYFNVIRKKTLKKINYFASYILEDYHFFKKYYPNNMLFTPVNLCNVDQYIVDKNLRVSENAKNILVGNSISFESNHIDAFKIINNVGLDDDSQIVVPLNYGDKTEYKYEVIKAGENYFREQFFPITDFIERGNYIEMLTSCSTGIFYHRRQQAMGNILAMLYLGCRIYLSKYNPVTEYFKRLGFIIFILEDEYALFKNTLLKPQESDQNRKLIDENFSFSKTKEYNKRLLETLHYEE